MQAAKDCGIGNPSVQTGFGEKEEKTIQLARQYMLQNGQSKSVNAIKEKLTAIRTFYDVWSFVIECLNVI